jgi:dihydropteroate synthase
MVDGRSWPVLDCNGRALDLSAPRVMGILNITPDSFSDGGLFFSAAAAIDQAARMVEEGAAVIDVGGESTRPGAADVPVQQELDRVIPVVEALAARFPVPISVDTSKPEVMREVVAAGAGLINDVQALRAPGAVELAASLGVPVCLMHMQGTPRTMQENPQYDDVVADVKAFLASRAAACEEAGIRSEAILLDPGFGFGKTLAHNCRLLDQLRSLATLGYPLLVGLSRKSMIGNILGLEADRRLHGSVAAAVIAVREGARIVRAHDVRPTVEAITVAHAVAG